MVDSKKIEDKDFVIVDSLEHYDQMNNENNVKMNSDKLNIDNNKSENADNYTTDINNINNDENKPKNNSDEDNLGNINIDNINNENENNIIEENNNKKFDENIYENKMAEDKNISKKKNKITIFIGTLDVNALESDLTFMIIITD